MKSLSKRLKPPPVSPVQRQDCLTVFITFQTRQFDNPPAYDSNWPCAMNHSSQNYILCVGLQPSANTMNTFKERLSKSDLFTFLCHAIDGYCG